jgi:hypothetical protein
MHNAKKRDKQDAHWEKHGKTASTVFILSILLSGSSASTARRAKEETLDFS